ncbi:dicarboxylate/amino acid:cation symporter, partial [Phascolarctobacterium faecium]|nr:dicarboxylate/amino acid:cation symporter [Phascolarctobacterium faecium]
GFIVQPGRGTTEFLDASAEVESVSYSFIDNIISWVPENIVQSMQEANMLQIIIFAIFLGVALLALGQKAELLIKVIDQGSEAM